MRGGGTRPGGAGRPPGTSLTVYSQDDPAFPEGVAGVVDDRELEVSWHLHLDTVPYPAAVAGGKEVGRIVGWDRRQWEEFTGCDGLGTGLPDFRPGCGSKTVEPGIAEALDVRFRGPRLRSRRVELSPLEDDMEALYSRGWTDGLPVVAPTEARVLAMLDGTHRQPDEIVAVVPPNLVAASVEKVAVNAVLAGCRPSTYRWSSRPSRRPARTSSTCTGCSPRRGLSSDGRRQRPPGQGGGNELRGERPRPGEPGQRHHRPGLATRHPQRRRRPAGRGGPGHLGTPGKYSFCFAEDRRARRGSPSRSNGASPPAYRRSRCSRAEVSTAWPIDSPAPRNRWLGRWRSPSRGVAHPKLVLGFDACLVISPDHGRVFRQAGWSKARLRAELAELLMLPRAELWFAAQAGSRRASRTTCPGRRCRNSRDGGLLIVYAGGGAGLFSAVIDGWRGGPSGSIPVTREVSR